MSDMAIAKLVQTVSALQAETDEANASAVDFANQANELHAKLAAADERIARLVKENVALTRKVLELRSQMDAAEIARPPAWGWEVDYRNGK